VLTGLPERMMTRGIAAKAMRAYTQETDRFNRQLAEATKAIAKIVRVVEQYGWHRALSDGRTELEAKQDSLTAR
jgi:site-specific DNA recombinase